MLPPTAVLSAKVGTLPPTAATSLGKLPGISSRSGGKVEGARQWESFESEYIPQRPPTDGQSLVYSSCDTDFVPHPGARDSVGEMSFMGHVKSSGSYLSSRRLGQ